MFKKIFLISLVVCFFVNQINAADPIPRKIVTKNYDAIEQVSEWLNVDRPLTAKDLEGRMVLLDFWTYGCSSCHQLMPVLHDLEKEMKKEFGDKFLIIGVHSANFENEKDIEGIRSAVLKHHITYPVINDKNLQLWNFFDVNMWPTLILLNPNGTININRDSHLPSKNGIEQLNKDIRKNIKTAFNDSPLPIKLEKDQVPQSFLKFPVKLAYVENFEGAPALFISNSGNNKIIGARLTGEVFIEIGSGHQGKDDGNFETAQFKHPKGLLYKDSILYVADTGNHLLRKIDFNTKKVTTIAGTGKPSDPDDVEEMPKKADARKAAMTSPWDLALYPSENKITIAMAGANQLWTYDIDNQTVSVIAGNGIESMIDGTYPNNTLSQPSGLSVLNDKLYFVDAESSALRVLKNGVIKTLIGKGLRVEGYTGYKEGTREEGRLNHPAGLLAQAGYIYIADEYNNAIRRYDIKNKRLENYSGNGQRGEHVGNIEETRYNAPSAIVKGGNLLYIADTNNNRILKLDPETQKVSVLDIGHAKVKEVHEKPSHEIKLKKLDENLKNKQTKHKVASDEYIQLSFMPEGAHLNKDAPSWFALFDITNPDAPINIHEYGMKDLSDGILKLPKLHIGHEYNLQGRILLCGEFCMPKKFSDGFIPEEGNENKRLHLKPLK